MDCQSKSTILKELCKAMDKIDKFSKISNVSKKYFSYN